MTRPKVAIGLDIGTSSVKATALTSDGVSLSRRSSPYASSTPFSGAVEQDPEDWWMAIGETLSSLLGDLPAEPGLTTIGLTGQMHTSVLRDRAGRLVRPAILWSDKRASEECAEIAATVPDVASVTGNPPMPAFTISHLAWLRKHEPRRFADIATVSLPKDDVRRRFGAGTTTEPSDASGTGLLDTRTDTWSDRLLQAVGVSREMMPAVLPSHVVSGQVRALPPGPKILERLLGAKVVGGAGDQAAQAVALGITRPGQLGFSIGTSGVAFKTLDAPAGGAFRHAYDERWLALDSTHAAGLALSWFAAVANRSVATLAEAPVGESAPLFLPYLQGHRGEAGAPGALVGLEIHHGAPEIAYAVMEGVAYELARLGESISGGSIPMGAVHLGGGGGRSERWRRLLADALDRSVIYTDRDSSFGAAIIAAEASGWLAEFSENDASCVTRTDPDPAAREVTATRRSRFGGLAGALAPTP